MAAIPSTGGILRTCVSHEVFPRSSSMSHHKSSSLKTCWIGISWTKLICIVGVLCLLTTSTHVLKDCLPNSWIQKDDNEGPHVFLYLFNWTNMYDPVNAHAMPNFVQLGPYVFRADGRGATNDTRAWFFEKQMSIGALDDLIGISPPPAPIVASRIRSWNQYMRKLMDFTLNNMAGCMVLDNTARKPLFEGYYDPLTEAAKLLGTELIPWYFSQHSALTDKSNDPVKESLTYRPCLTEGPLHTAYFDLERRGNCSDVKGVDAEGIFSDNDIVGILRDLGEFSAPFVIVTEREKMSETLALLRKLAFYWLDSHWLVIGTGALLCSALLFIGGIFQKESRHHYVVQQQH